VRDANHAKAILISQVCKGDLKINISGCMNGCAHQSVGHIGILGVDKKGVEWYQVTLGGSSENDAAIGERLGPAVSKQDITAVVHQTPVLSPDDCYAEQACRALFPSALMKQYYNQMLVHHHRQRTPNHLE
jgi:dissimilatory sulfite reductase (desulfoviridin) alpha/beta subunit